MKKSSKYLCEELEYIGVHRKLDDIKNITILAERKYNRYDQYLPGETFQSRLIRWLENFERKDREIAMNIVDNLYYINNYELRALSTSTFWNSIKIIQKEISKQEQPKKILKVYLKKKEEETNMALKKSLYVAVSDDVMFDYFRRRAQGKFSFLKKDNFVEYYKLHPVCQKDDLGDLEDIDRIFLLDQLCGSGITFLRKEGKKWKGKIKRFFDIWRNLESKNIYYLPYIISTVAWNRINRLIFNWRKEMKIPNEIIVQPTLKVPMSKCLSENQNGPVNPKLPVAKLCEKYFDDCILDEHTEKGGNCKWGFGDAGLTLVLNTNCPNNTIPLIWRSCGDWYPLFPRIEHHP